MVGFLSALRAAAFALFLIAPMHAMAAPAADATAVIAPSVAGTSWQGEEHFDDGRVWQARYDFHADGTILETYWGPDSGTCEGRWTQTGAQVSFWTFGHVLNRLEVIRKGDEIIGALTGPSLTARVKAKLLLPLTS